ncbi:ABC transporter permease [candidate division CSSED10-310 bacterium]|uniref:ABC transporter permease n=1 Tax=candidate division CSSED10-310 bacterium TaxID=2855610 RepID=A0ABV6YSW7_UNCC1
MRALFRKEFHHITIVALAFLSILALDLFVYPATTSLDTLSWFDINFSTPGEDQVSSALFLAIISLIFAYCLFPGEYEEQTVNFLNTLPVSRWKVFIVKVLTVQIVLAGGLLLEQFNYWILQLFSTETYVVDQYRLSIALSYWFLQSCFCFIVLAHSILLSFFRRFGLVLFTMIILLGQIISEQWPELEVINVVQILEVEFRGGQLIIPWQAVIFHVTMACISLLIASFLWFRAAERVMYRYHRFIKTSWGKATSISLNIIIVLLSISIIYHVSDEENDTLVTFTPFETARFDTRHYHFLYPTNVRSRALDLIKRADRVYSDIRHELNLNPTTRIDVDLRQSSGEYSNISKGKEIHLDITTDIGLRTLIRTFYHQTLNALENDLFGRKQQQQNHYLAFFEKGLAEYFAFKFVPDQDEEYWHKILGAVAWQRQKIEFRTLADRRDFRKTHAEKLYYPLGKAWIEALISKYDPASIRKIIEIISRERLPPHNKGAVKYWHDILQHAQYDVAAVIEAWQQALTEFSSKNAAVMDSIPSLRGEVTSFGMTDTTLVATIPVEKFHPGHSYTVRIKNNMNAKEQDIKVYPGTPLPGSIPLKIEFKVPTRTLTAGHLFFQFGVTFRQNISAYYEKWQSSPIPASKKEEKGEGFVDILKNMSDVKQRSLNVRGFTIDVSYNPIKFKELEDLGDTFFGLEQRDREIQIYFLTLEEYTDLDGALESVRMAIVEDDADFTIVKKEDVTVSGKVSKMMLLRAKYGKETYDFSLYSIPLRSGLNLDLRFITPAPAEDYSKIIDTFLSNLKITDPPKIDAFPEVKVKEKSFPVNEHVRSLLEHSKRIGNMGTKSRGQMIAKLGNQIYTSSGYEIISLSLETGKKTTLFRSEKWNELEPVGLYKGSLLLVSKDDKVNYIIESKLQPLSWNASRIRIIQDNKLLLTRRPEDLTVTGWDYLPDERGDQLIIRNQNGKEQTISMSKNRRVETMGVDRPGTKALLATSELSMFPVYSEYSLLQLSLLTIQSEKWRDLGQWQTISRIASADNAWLLTGQPEDGLQGIYRLDEQGKSKLLISGSNFTGIDLNSKQLIFTTSAKLSHDPAPKDDFIVYQIGLDHIQKNGILAMPFSVPVLNEIASTVFKETGLIPASLEVFTSRAAIKEFVETANTICNRKIGRPFPHRPFEFDDLLSELGYAPLDLSEGGFQLICALYCEILLREGAIWIDGSVSHPSFAYSRTDMTNLFVLPILPLELIRDTLYSEDGWHRPATDVIKYAAGRKFVLSGDPEALDRKTLEFNVQKQQVITLINQKRFKELKQYVLKRIANNYLRGEIYKRLAARKHHQVLIDIAGTFCRRDEATVDDHRAWLSARFSSLKDKTDVKHIIEDLRSTIKLFPQDEVFYYLLGLAYERDDRPNAIAYARACYDKVLDLNSWSLSAQKSQEALDRLQN